MKQSILLALALLLPITAVAGQQCEKDAKGNVSCTQTTEEANSQPGAVRETPSNSDATKAHNQERKNGKEREQEEQGVGSDTSQSMEPGITY